HEILVRMPWCRGRLSCGKSPDDAVAALRWAVGFCLTRIRGDAALRTNLAIGDSHSGTSGTLAMIRRIFAVAVVTVVGLSGCASKREAPAPAPVESAAPPATVDTGSSIRPGSAEDFRVNVGDTVNFDYDRYSIGAEAQAILQRQA